MPIPEVKDIVLDGQGVQEVKILEDKAKITQTEICQLAFLDFGDVLIVQDNRATRRLVQGC